MVFSNANKVDEKLSQIAINLILDFSVWCFVNLGHRLKFLQEVEIKQLAKKFTIKEDCTMLLTYRGLSYERNCSESKNLSNNDYSIYRGVRYYFSIPVMRKQKKSPQNLTYRGASYSIE